MWQKQNQNKAHTTQEHCWALNVQRVTLGCRLLGPWPLPQPPDGHVGRCKQRAAGRTSQETSCPAAPCLAHCRLSRAETGVSTHRRVLHNQVQRLELCRQAWAPLGTQQRLDRRGRAHGQQEAGKHPCAPAMLVSKEGDSMAARGDLWGSLALVPSDLAHVWWL